MRLAVAALVAALSLPGTMPWHAEAAEPVYAGAGPAREGATPGATKLPADAAIKAGMKSIRSATIDVLTLVTHRRMPPDMAQSYAKAVAGQVDAIEREAARDPAVVKELEPLLGDIVRGAEAVAGRGDGLDPIEGILLVAEALGTYGQRFDDPDWKPLR